jgi:hypothetical protein
MKTNKTTAPRRPARKPKEESPKVRPFEDVHQYLEAWFGVLGPNREPDESPAALSNIPSFDDRKGYLGYISDCTTASLEAGLSLPLEVFIARHDLDVVDRLILLALLRAALDPVSEGGISLVYILRALGADSYARRVAVASRLDEEGTLRSLCAVHCIPSSHLKDRVYRLAPWLVKPLTTGEGDADGIPNRIPDPVEVIDKMTSEVVAVWEAVKLDINQATTIWSGPVAGGGWDHIVLRRRRLASGLEALVRAEGSNVGAELRRLQLEGDERLCWAMLLVDGMDSPVGIPVPRLLRYCGPATDPEATAVRLLGPESKLGRGDCVRFNRADAPLLRRIVWMSREAHACVVPWSREDFAVAPGPTGEPPAPNPGRVMGFDAQGAAAEGLSRLAKGAA